MSKKGPTQADEKHPYQSPTTPGLYVTLRAYIIELVCLNMERRLAPRFWRGEYWSKKFAREVRGVRLLLDEMGGAENPVYQKAIFRAIKKTGCQSLMRKTTREKIVRATKKAYGAIMAERKLMADHTPNVEVGSDYMAKNAKFVNPAGDDKLSKIRGVENG